MEEPLKPARSSEPKLDHTISIRIDKELFTELQDAAACTGTSLGILIRALIMGQKPAKPTCFLDRGDVMRLLSAATMAERRLESILATIDSAATRSTMDRSMVDSVLKSLALINEDLRRVLPYAH